MCKVAGITKVNDKNRDEIWLFMQILGDYMSIGNEDGLGYAAFDGNGNLFGERWLQNKTAFTDLSREKGLSAEKMMKVYSFFGDKVLRDEAKAIILHTRFATCGRGIANTHPFVDDLDSPQVAVIHNGVITNEEAFVKKFSTCDSEVLAHLYMKHSVRNTLENINKFSAKLEGWYTVLNLARDANKEPIMDIYTMNGRLTSYFIPHFGTRVYCTDARCIQGAAEFMGLKLTDAAESRAYRGYRLSVETGDILERVELERPKYYESIDGWGNHPNVTHAHGNMSDPDFRDAFFGGLNNVSRNWSK